MTDHFTPIVVFVTAPSRDEARRLADAIVERRLAACVQLLPQIESIYRWKGQTERQEETLLILKTSASRFEELERAVREMHSYETPEIVAFPLTAGSPDYLRWLEDCVNQDDV